MHRVMVEPATYENCRRAVAKAFEIFAPEVRAKTVLVKPNVLRAAEPREAITTHPAVVKAVVEYLQASGAGRIIVGDNPGAHQPRGIPRTPSNSRMASSGSTTLMVVMPKPRAGFRLMPRSSRYTASSGRMSSFSQAIR